MLRVRLSRLSGGPLAAKSMKYFTIEDWMGDQDLDAARSPSWDASEEYSKYLDSVDHLIPAEFRSLQDSVYLHDSNLHELRIDLPSGTLEMLFHACDRQQHACAVRIQYAGVTLFESTSDPEKSLPGPGGYGDFGYEEIEVIGAARFEHRILFSSGIELLIRFAQLSFTVTPNTSADGGG